MRLAAALFIFAVAELIGRSVGLRRVSLRLAKKEDAVSPLQGGASSLAAHTAYDHAEVRVASALDAVDFGARSVYDAAVVRADTVVGHVAIAGGTAFIAFLVVFSVASFASPARSDCLGAGEGASSVHSVRESWAVSVASSDQDPDASSSKGLSAPTRLPAKMDSLVVPSTLFHQARQQAQLSHDQHSTQLPPQTTSLILPDTAAMDFGLTWNSSTSSSKLEPPRRIPWDPSLSQVCEEVAAFMSSGVLTQGGSAPNGASNSANLDSEEIAQSSVAADQEEVVDGNSMEPTSSFWFSPVGRLPSAVDLPSSSTTGYVDLPGEAASNPGAGVSAGIMQPSISSEMGVMTTIGGNRRKEAEVFAGASPELRLALRQQAQRVAQRQRAAQS